MTSQKNHDRRPLSPHLSIYKPQISSMLSILHRITGVVLYAGAFILAMWVILSVYGCESCIRPLFQFTAVKVILFGWNLALFYHLFNGIRHIMWDAGYGFSLPVMRRSGWAVLLLSTSLTILVWVCALKINYSLF
jgi:succinate dehydrogenase / fumarate reductase cytochrome b subunit